MTISVVPRAFPYQIGSDRESNRLIGKGAKMKVQKMAIFEHTQIAFYSMGIFFDRDNILQIGKPARTNCVGHVDSQRRGKFCTFHWSENVFDRERRGKCKEKNNFSKKIKKNFKFFEKFFFKMKNLFSKWKIFGCHFGCEIWTHFGGHFFGKIFVKIWTHFF